MKRLFLAFMLLCPFDVIADTMPAVFGDGGQIKMLYDRRLRPQSLYLNGKVYLVYNGGAAPDSRPGTPTHPVAIVYDPATRSFSKPVTLGREGKDQHYEPMIWPDPDGYLHVLFGCHKNPGTHIISKKPLSIGTSQQDWRVGPEIAPGISYPTAFRIYDDKEVISYRTAGHSSSWTYRISSDMGKTWVAPKNDVTDLDILGRTEYSAYQTRLISRDGKYLHVAFISYDDCKSNDPKRLFNPRYGKPVSNGWKYNLYYIKINLVTGEVTNFDGAPMRTPIDLDQANAKCRIWDTKGRGAGVPPDIVLDKNGEPTFLHVLSEDTLTDHTYYYVRRVNGRWKETPITHSNHQWNSAHLTCAADGTLHAYLIVGDGYLDVPGYMNSYGGGDIEEWVSTDKGETWSKKRDLTPDRSKYPGWRYNNVQSVTRSDGSIVDGMLIFYGWKDKDAPHAKAFLLDETRR